MFSIYRNWSRFNFFRTHEYSIKIYYRPLNARSTIYSCREQRLHWFQKKFSRVKPSWFVGDELPWVFLTYISNYLYLGNHLRQLFNVASCISSRCWWLVTLYLIQLQYTDRLKWSCARQLALLLSVLDFIVCLCIRWSLYRH